MSKPNKEWWVYILRCADGTLYCGSTPDMRARIKAHNQKKGARYTRGRTPVTLAYSRRMANKSQAFQEEARIKRLVRGRKLELISNCAAQ